MYVFDQSGSIDSAKLIDYITKDFPGEFKQLIEARDELAKRQGAMSAVDKAVKDREKAAATLAAAEAKASAMLADAQAEAQAATTKLAEVLAREAALDKLQQEFDVKSAAAANELTAAKAQIAAREQTLADAQLLCNDKLAALESDRASLNARIKAFQDKVAALSA